MQLQELLRGLEARQTFTMLASALKQEGLDAVVSTGWPVTATRLEELAVASPDRDIVTLLFDVYLENVLHTNKAVMLWPIESAVALQLCNVMASFIDPDSQYLGPYPLPLSDGELRSVNTFGVPTGYHEIDGAHTLVFASRREKVEQTVLPIEQMPATLLDAGFTQFYGKRHHVFQVFDSITVRPALGLIELRIDQAKALSEKDILAYKEAITQRFNKLVRDNTGIERLLGQAVNLVPALEPLYRGTDWVVHHISHQNEAGYSNSNKGKYRTDDVRDDTYHIEGEAAVGSIQLWQVNAAFKSSVSAYAPLLILEGHSSMLNSLLPFMDIARIFDCATSAEYETIFSALMTCLGVTAAGS